MTYADSLAVLQNHQTYTSEKGMRIDAHPRAVESASGRMLIVTDPPRHTQLRDVLGSAFKRSTLNRLEVNIRRSARDLIFRALEIEDCDFVRDIAGPFPPTVICDILGVPQADWGHLGELTATAFGNSGSSERERAAAHSEIMLYYTDLAAHKRRHGGDDLVTALVNARIDGTALTDAEIILNCDGLLSGGNETTRHASTGGVLALHQCPEQWQLLQKSPAALPRAVEEILRWTSPALHILRVATTDTELHGKSIAAGDMVVVWPPSANRDESVFANPESFDVSRTPNRHLAFGAGVHTCIGSLLGRLELRILFEELIAAVRSIEVTRPPKRLASNLFWGFAELPVTLHPH
ncbi:cytochrome P450 [Kribbella sp. WER1]